MTSFSITWVEIIIRVEFVSAAWASLSWFYNLLGSSGGFDELLGLGSPFSRSLKSSLFESHFLPLNVPSRVFEKSETTWKNTILLPVIWQTTNKLFPSLICNSPMKPFVTSITANHESSIVRLSTHGTIVLFSVSLKHEHQEYHCVIVITQSRVVRKGFNVNLGLKVHIGLNCSCRRTCARATVLLGFISIWLETNGQKMQTKYPFAGL